MLPILNCLHVGLDLLGPVVMNSQLPKIYGNSEDPNTEAPKGKGAGIPPPQLLWKRLLIWILLQILPLLCFIRVLFKLDAIWYDFVYVWKGHAVRFGHARCNRITATAPKHATTGWCAFVQSIRLDVILLIFLIILVVVFYEMRVHCVTTSGNDALGVIVHEAGKTLTLDDLWPTMHLPVSI